MRPCCPPSCSPMRISRGTFTPVALLYLLEHVVAYALPRSSCLTMLLRVALPRSLTLFLFVFHLRRVLVPLLEVDVSAIKQVLDDSAAGQTNAGALLHRLSAVLECSNENSTAAEEALRHVMSLRERLSRRDEPLDLEADATVASPSEASRRGASAGAMAGVQDTGKLDVGTPATVAATPSPTSAAGPSAAAAALAGLGSATHTDTTHAAAAQRESVHGAPTAASHQSAQTPAPALAQPRAATDPRRTAPQMSPFAQPTTTAATAPASVIPHHRGFADATPHATQGRSGATGAASKSVLANETEQEHRGLRDGTEQGSPILPSRASAAANRSRVEPDEPHSAISRRDSLLDDDDDHSGRSSRGGTLADTRQRAAAAAAARPRHGQPSRTPDIATGGPDLVPGETKAAPTTSLARVPEAHGEDAAGAADSAGSYSDLQGGQQHDGRTILAAVRQLTARLESNADVAETTDLLQRLTALLHAAGEDDAALRGPEIEAALRLANHALARTHLRVGPSSPDVSLRALDGSMAPVLATPGLGPDEYRSLPARARAHVPQPLPPVFLADLAAGDAAREPSRQLRPAEQDGEEEQQERREQPVQEEGAENGSTPASVSHSASPESPSAGSRRRWADSPRMTAPPLLHPLGVSPPSPPRATAAGRAQAAVQTHDDSLLATGGPWETDVHYSRGAPGRSDAPAFAAAGVRTPPTPTTSDEYYVAAARARDDRASREQQRSQHDGLLLKHDSHLLNIGGSGPSLLQAPSVVDLGTGVVGLPLTATVHLRNNHTEWLHCRATVVGDGGGFVTEEGCAIAPHGHGALRVGLLAHHHGVRRALLHLHARTLGAAGETLSPAAGGAADRVTCALRATLEEPNIVTAPRDAVRFGVVAVDSFAVQPLALHNPTGAALTLGIRLGTPEEDHTPFSVWDYDPTAELRALAHRAAQAAEGRAEQGLNTGTTGGANGAAGAQSSPHAPHFPHAPPAEGDVMWEWVDRCAAHLGVRVRVPPATERAGPVHVWVAFAPSASRDMPADLLQSEDYRFCQTAEVLLLPPVEACSAPDAGDAHQEDDLAGHTGTRASHTQQQQQSSTTFETWLQRVTSGEPAAVLSTVELEGTCSTPRLQVPRVMQAMVLKAAPGKTALRKIPVRNASAVAAAVAVAVRADTGPGCDSGSFSVTPLRFELGPMEVGEVVVRFTAPWPDADLAAKLSMTLLPNGTAYRLALRGQAVALDEADGGTLSAATAAAAAAQGPGAGWTRPGERGTGHGYGDGHANGHGHGTVTVNGDAPAAAHGRYERDREHDGYRVGGGVEYGGYDQRDYRHGQNYTARQATDADMEMPPLHSAPPRTYSLVEHERMDGHASQSPEAQPAYLSRQPAPAADAGVAILADQAVVSFESVGVRQQASARLRLRTPAASPDLELRFDVQGEDGSVFALVGSPVMCLHWGTAPRHDRGTTHAHAQQQGSQRTAVAGVAELQQGQELAVDLQYCPTRVAVHRATLLIKARRWGATRYAYRFRMPLLGVGGRSRVLLEGAHIARGRGDISLTPPGLPGAGATQVVTLGLADLEANRPLTLELQLRNAGDRAGFVLTRCLTAEMQPLSAAQVAIVPEGVVVGPQRRYTVRLTLTPRAQALLREAAAGASRGTGGVSRAEGGASRDSHGHTTAATGLRISPLLTVQLYTGDEVLRTRLRRHIHRAQREGGSANVAAHLLGFHRHFTHEERFVDRELPGAVHRGDSVVDVDAFQRQLLCIRLAVACAASPRALREHLGGTHAAATGHSGLSGSDRVRRSTADAVALSEAGVGGSVAHVLAQAQAAQAGQRARHVPPPVRMDIVLSNGQMEVHERAGRARREEPRAEEQGAFSGLPFFLFPPFLFCFCISSTLEALSLPPFPVSLAICSTLFRGSSPFLTFLVPTLPLSCRSSTSFLRSDGWIWWVSAFYVLVFLTSPSSPDLHLVAPILQMGLAAFLCARRLDKRRRG